MNEMEFDKLIRDSVEVASQSDAFVPDMSSKISAIASSAPVQNPNLLRRRKMEKSENVGLARRSIWGRMTALATACIMLLVGLGVGGYFIFRDSTGLRNGTYRFTGGGTSISVNPASAQNAYMNFAPLSEDPLSIHFEHPALANLQFERQTGGQLTAREFVEIQAQERLNFGMHFINWFIQDLDRTARGIPHIHNSVLHWHSYTFPNHDFGYVFWNYMNGMEGVFDPSGIVTDSNAIDYLISQLEETFMWQRMLERDISEFVGDVRQHMIDVWTEVLTTHFNQPVFIGQWGYPNLFYNSFADYVTGMYTAWLARFTEAHEKYLPMFNIDPTGLTLEQREILRILYSEFMLYAETLFIVNGNQLTITSRVAIFVGEGLNSDPARTITNQFHVGGRTNWGGNFYLTSLAYVRQDSGGTYYQGTEFGVRNGMITYVFRVHDVGDETEFFFMSWARNAVQVRELAAPIVTVTGSVVSWNWVLGATAYSVYVNNQQVASLVGREFSLGTLLLATGTHTVQVRAVRDDIVSPLSEAVQFIV